jgi:outer membrane protein assembly factor BamB
VVVAVDAKTGQQLWSMPNGTNGTEPVPLVTDAWHGLVYATTTEGLTMVYRARSGSPVRTSAGPTPVLVNDQAGLALDPNGPNIVAQRPID